MRTGVPGLRPFRPVDSHVPQSPREEEHMSQQGCDRPVDGGASSVEYGLILGAIAAIVVAVVVGLGGAAKDQFSTASSCIAAGADSTC